MSRPVWVVEEQDNKLSLRPQNKHIVYKSNWRPIVAFMGIKEAKEYIRKHKRPWAVRLEFYFSPNYWKSLKCTPHEPLWTDKYI